MFSLPVSFGGLGIHTKLQESVTNFHVSCLILWLIRFFNNAILSLMILSIHNILFLNNSLKINIRVRWTQCSQFAYLPIICIKLLGALRRREACMGSHFIRPTLLMPYVYAMAGFHHTYLQFSLCLLQSFYYISFFELPMHTVLFPSSTIMMYKI